ncbi:CamS family sex pheromone protein [Brevibacillus dissolubilis]|uniref:CamS family sex pheromone protein n=1 Tax=Brevibacillus dissolubilis TaxID=1844116 RepID=UPI0011174EF6|nr:CamS family sex pheromone protein [Brevibacillus dissolubilis]
MKKTWNRLTRYSLLVTCCLALTACSFFGSRPSEEAPEPATPTISSVFQISDKHYGGVVPYRPNQTRGMLAERDYRIDFSHLELGMMEIAQETFSTEEYLFQEGQRISKEQVEAWVSRSSKNQEGLNPPKGKNLLIQVLEHDYVSKQQNGPFGMVISLALNPVYTDPSGQEKEFTVDELRAKGQQLSARIVQKIRAENQQVPMVIALYQVPGRSSTLVPGRFIMTGTVNATDSSVSKWQPIQEEFFLFPGSDAESEYPQISMQYDKLKKNVQGFFGEYIGLTGLGRFMDGELVELTITASAEYDSRTEVLQFTQYAAGLINQYFDKKVHVNLYVQSITAPLAIYVRPSEGEPYMHIYRK